MSPIAATVRFAIHTTAGVLMLDHDLVCRWVALSDLTSELHDLIGARFLAAINQGAVGLRPQIGSILLFLHWRGGRARASATPPVLDVECMHGG